MANLILCSPALSDAGTIYAITSQSVDAPCSNLQLMQPKEVYETTTVTGNLDFHIDLLAGASYDTFALLFTNATAAATWSINGSNSSTIGSGFDANPILASTTLRAVGQSTYSRYHAFYKHSSTLTYRYIRIRVADSGNTEGVFRAGRLYICAAYSPTVNAQYGLTMGYDDIALGQTMTSAGERIPRRNEPVPILSFTLAANGASAWAEVQQNLYDLHRQRGGSRDVMVVVDPADASYVGRLIHYGTMQPRLAVTLPAYNYYQSAYEITGLI